jgi:phosphatidylserine/phosphatidylglycerophosphate/cardiolipin synthase-like enzyme
MVDVPPVAYFPPATPHCPTFVDDSEWHPIIDGEDYFTELDTALRGLGPGDSVQISGLELWPGLDLCGRRPGTPGYDPLGQRLVAVAAAGAQVRILLAGRVVARSMRVPALRGFRQNVRNARALNAARPHGTTGPAPLAGCVLVDWSSVAAGSNHQKVVVVDRGGIVTAYVAGIDLVDNRWDAPPHDRLRLKGRRWGWHDAAVRLRGPAATQVHGILGLRWREASTLPARYAAPGRLINPRSSAPPLAPAPSQPAVPSPGTAVRVGRSVAGRKADSIRPWRRRAWDVLPLGGVHEIFETLTTALTSARHHVYLEDQYLEESLGGKQRYELYPYLRDAAQRGVKIVLVGSGVRDPDDPGIYLRPINRRLNRDLRTKLVEPLTSTARANVVMWRIEHCTVHAKLVLIDDAFASIGSANMFSRSMSGTDSEVTAAVSTSSSLVRDLRVRVWGEHLRSPVDKDLRRALVDPDTALGMWQRAWVPSGTPDRWREWSRQSMLRPVWPTAAR